MLKTISIDVKYVVIAMALCLFTMASLSGTASATLAGENGPIVYVEQEEQKYECNVELQVQQTDDDEWECDESGNVTQVITTDNEGENPVVAAEFSEEDGEQATTATISPNDEDGNHTIVFGTEKFECVPHEGWEPVDVSRVSEREDMCYFYNASAVIYSVQIDTDGNPLGEPVLVSMSENEDGVLFYDNYYVELSYAPDGQTVVGTRFYFSQPSHDGGDCIDICTSVVDAEEEHNYGPNLVIETVNLETGVVTELVGPRFDPFMNAGYGQNGNIYFTQAPERDIAGRIQGVEEEMNKSSEVWYFTPGSTEAVQLTNTPRINEYFLSVSPDSAQVLVCDPFEMRFYLVSTTTGDVAMIDFDDSDIPFLPKFFSPNGEGYLGIKDFKAFYDICGQRLEASRVLAVALDVAEVENDRGVAYAALNDFQNAVVYNDMQNPDDWAPIVAYADEQTPQVLGTTTTTVEKLQSTGSSSIFGFLAGGMIATTAAGASVKKKD